MPGQSYYSPCINREIVRALYHEAKHRRLPMTRLVDELLTRALSGTTGWQIAHDTSVAGATRNRSTPPRALILTKRPSP